MQVNELGTVGAWTSILGTRIRLDTSSFSPVYWCTGRQLDKFLHGGREYDGSGTEGELVANPRLTA